MEQILFNLKTAFNSLTLSRELFQNHEDEVPELQIRTNTLVYHSGSPV
jgi:hypothetical protein